jgi:hypothetical protein
METQISIAWWCIVDGEILVFCLMSFSEATLEFIECIEFYLLLQRTHAIARALSSNQLHNLNLMNSCASLCDVDLHGRHENRYQVTTPVGDTSLLSGGSRLVWTAVV